MKIYTLGTSHGRAEKGRGCSGTLIESHDVNYLFDCGGDVEGKMQNLGLSIDGIRSVFISHMHEDHVGSLSSIVKLFTIYIDKGESVQLFIPEENAIDAFKNWLAAMHLTFPEEKVAFTVVKSGEIYSDDNITVTAIPTRHIENGKFPSFAYSIYTENKKILYTGDLSTGFMDYPAVLFEEKYDIVICECVHFDLEKNLDIISKTKTNKMIFTHLSNERAAKIVSNKDKFPFEVCVAEDGMCF